VGKTPDLKDRAKHRIQNTKKLWYNINTMAHVKGPDPQEQDESTTETYELVDESTGEEIAAAGNLYGTTGKPLHPIKPNEWNA